MAVHQIETFEVDEGRPIIGRSGRFHDADDRESQFVSMSARIAVCRKDLVTDTDVHLIGDARAYDCLEIAMFI